MNSNNQFSLNNLPLKEYLNEMTYDSSGYCKAIYYFPIGKNIYNCNNSEAFKTEYDCTWIGNESLKIPKIKKIIFNNPATIIYWKDGTKTVVKTSPDDVFNEEIGVAMAYMKKIFEGSRKFKKTIEKLKSY